MNRILLKDIQRLIKNTLGRFLSLFAIVMIGVAFYVGVSSSAPIMGSSVDAYDDAYNLKDITIYSNYGFDEEDLAAVNKLENVDHAELTQFVDVNASSGVNNYVTRIHAYSDSKTINQFVLVDGRMPQNENECLAENNSSLSKYFEIGSTIELSRPEDEITDYLSVNKLKVVGTIESPLYIDEAKENSTLSNQYISTYLYVPEKAFTLDYYMEMNVLVKDAKKMNSFEEEYKEYVESVKEEIETVAKTQASNRYDEVVEEATQKYNDGLKEYNEGLEEYNQKIADAEKEITDGEQKLIDGQQAITDGEAQLNASQNTLNEKAAELKDAQNQLDTKKTEFEQQKVELNKNIDQIDEGIKAINDSIPSLNNAYDGVVQLNTLKQGLQQTSALAPVIAGYQAALGNNATIEQMKAAIQADPSFPNKEATINGIDGAIVAYTSANKLLTNTDVSIVMIQDLANQLSQQATFVAGIDANINGIYAQLNQNLPAGTEQINSADQIKNYMDQLNQQVIDLNTNRQKIVDGIADGEQQLLQAQAQIDDGNHQITSGQQTINENRATLEEKKQELAQGQIDIDDAKQQLEEAKKDGQQELDDAKSKLDKAKQDIDDLAKGEWTVLDRRSGHYSTVAYKGTIEQMTAIAAVFPVFFFMVAALVCLTTMTRMIDEQRGQIGVLRALGYTQGQCTMKYLFYAGAATIIGSLIGNVVGMLIFPGIIYNAWRMMYILPEMQLTISWPIILMSNVGFTAVMLATTWFACHEDMKEVSAQLMRPKSPKIGKSTFIERIPFVWNHLSFTWKVTVRNLFRYKKRFVMTVIGVAGCTALLITGFGIRDSIETIATKQFEEIYRYDGIASFSSDLSSSEVDQVYAEYAKKDEIQASIKLGVYSGLISNHGADEETVSVQVFNQASEAYEMYDLKKRETQKNLTLEDDGVILSEKLAQNLNKKIGDTVTIESKDGVKKEVKITGITEMYVRHYVFMTKAYYKSIFGTSLSDNTMLIQVTDNQASRKALQEDIAKSTNFEGIEFYDSLLDNFNNMIHGLDFIIVVLIIASASLAFVVLGNLTNVNISERMREIATLKVLGFRKKEVENYIYKENNVLTFIGALVGIPLGTLLHHYIMRQVEMDYVMFGRDVSWISFLICVVITLIFGFIVNLCMKRKLHQIEMVESLKSVE